MTCKTPCKECPFRRDSAPGYLGAASGNPIGFIWAHWQGPLHLPCHMAVDWEKDDAQEQVQNTHTCIGYTTMCKNSAKLPVHPTDVTAVQAVTAGRETVFSHIGEFVLHHGGKIEDTMNPTRIKYLMENPHQHDSNPKHPDGVE